MSGLVLGLDLGPNSLGWALVDESEGGKGLIDCGVRVFPEGVDNFDTKKETPRNEARRIARGMRRQIARRARRKRRLREALIASGLYPAGPGEQKKLEGLDPYELRARALDEPLKPYEIGRILLHFGQRRGFLSNRKRERTNNEVKGMLAEMSALQADIEATGARTLGEYLHRKSREMNHCKRVDNDHVRRRHTRRDMLSYEFDRIWKEQSKHHAGLLTDKLRYGASGAAQKFPSLPRRRKKGQSFLDAFGVEGLIFFQRPIYWPRSVVGKCELEPKQKRCARADRRAQRFRLLQEVNNLRYIDPDTNQERSLSPEHRDTLLKKLSRSKEMDFDKIRKALGLHESVQFNLESGKRKKLWGMVTDSLLAAKGAYGPKWHELAEQTKNRVVELLVLSTDDDETAERLIEECGLTRSQAESVLGVDLPQGYIHLSVMALNKLIPPLERGLKLMGNDETDSAMHAAGYMRRDQLQRRVFDHLPDPTRARDARIGDIPSPVVKRAIVELRKVVNAIIREYGKPAAVHVELTRQVRQGPEARREYTSRIREIEEERAAAADEIRKLKIGGASVAVNRDSILRWLLWKQQNHDCIYCGNKISQAQLFGGEIDVDHILPYSRSLDDSQMNKVVCHRNCNSDKGNQAPYEWLCDKNPKKYAEVLQHALSLVRRGTLPYKKYRRISQKDLILDDFIARQLTATGYITSATVEYLKCLFENEHAVLGLKGELTAELRHQWGLDDVLSSLPDSPAWQEQADLRSGEKNRADHRHHAIDAIVVALTNRSRLQQLSRIRKRGGGDRADEALPAPWASFRDDVVAKIRDINVSRRAKRKVAGALHDDNPFGKTQRPGYFVKRKPLIELSPSEIDKIRDAAIKDIVKGELSRAGIIAGRGKGVDGGAMKKVLAELTMPSGVPIKRARLLVPSETIRPIREKTPHEVQVNPMSTHHLALFEWDEGGKTKRKAVFVTMIDAIKRLKCHEPIIQRNPPNNNAGIPQNARFVFSLSGGELVLVDVGGNKKLLVFDTAAQTSQQMWFYEHTDARKHKRLYSFMPNTLKARKVTVDPLGRIRWAND
ncbi:MAG: CRISPR-associated endonuclease Cas9 [Phycisphaerae bacterium]|nr:MAG: type II CRISPR RNA-guided endonuclease Cas9 [Planctomycetia bacterium]RIK69783.1 MAG: type II CRISPR RNA-guided endonuclease Cas9 [Planctomycetota bacterium]GJQ26110.1 MAG: CRISPR-associated endonuclease Cas9 [Phycisphaerae bacterium]